MHASNPSTLEAEVGGSLQVRGQSGLQSKLQDRQGYTEKPSLEKQKQKVSSWRDGSEVKSISYSGGLEFNSQQPHGGASQVPIMRPGALFWHIGIHTGRTLYM